MKTYLMYNDDHVLDETLFNFLDSTGVHYDGVLLPAEHHEVGPILSDLEGGAVFLPAKWKDLFCVKVIQEISLMTMPFETVLVDRAPEISNLIVAFNEGLSGFLETPVTEEKFAVMISRIKSRYEDKVSHLSGVQRPAGLSSQSTSINGSHSMNVRNQHLGMAFIDIANQTGPLFEKEVEVLVVSSSSVQLKQLEGTLKKIGITSTKSGSIEETTQIVEKKEFPVVVSDSFLPDGDAVTLADNLKKTSKSMPHIIVWSASPDKAVHLVKPENHIGEVLIKRGPESGTESLLPSIISVIYEA